jgi:CHAT domain-containing protein
VGKDRVPSACSTAESKAARLSNEVIHMVSGFQVAGFAPVIGCLWLSADSVCVEIARSFYIELFKMGGDMVNEEVAVALHKSVITATDVGWNQPLMRSQFVHYGP